MEVFDFERTRMHGEQIAIERLRIWGVPIPPKARLIVDRDFNPVLQIDERFKPAIALFLLLANGYNPCDPEVETQDQNED